MENKIRVDQKQIIEKLTRARNLLLQKKRWVLLFIALLALTYCSYLWYVAIINPKWNDGQKQEYINTKEGQLKFNQEKFDTVIGEIERRKNEYNNKTENLTDIFRLR